MKSLASIRPERSAQKDQLRRRGRTSLSIPVDVRKDGVSCPAVTRNISRDGAFVATDQPPAVGERITLRLAAPRYSLPLVLRAQVRWIRTVAEADDEQRPAGIGVEFFDTTIGVSLCLAALLEDHQDDEL